MIRNLLKLVIVSAAVFFAVFLFMAALCGDTVAAIIMVVISVGGMIFNGDI